MSVTFYTTNHFWHHYQVLCAGKRRARTTVICRKLGSGRPLNLTNTHSPRRIDEGTKPMPYDASAARQDVFDLIQRNFPDLRIICIE